MNPTPGSGAHAGLRLPSRDQPGNDFPRRSSFSFHRWAQAIPSTLICRRPREKGNDLESINGAGHFAPYAPAAASKEAPPSCTHGAGRPPAGVGLRSCFVPTCHATPRTARLARASDGDNGSSPVTRRRNPVSSCHSSGAESPFLRGKADAETLKGVWGRETL